MKCDNCKYKKFDAIKCNVFRLRYELYEIVKTVIKIEQPICDEMESEYNDKE